MSRTRGLWGSLLAGALLALAGAGDAARAAEGASIEPQAESLLRAALGKVAGAGSFTFRAETVDDVPLPSGERVEFPGTLEVAVKRPNRLRLRSDGGRRGARSWYDGKTYVLLSPEANTYATCPGPERLDDLFTQLRENYGFTPPLSTLLRADVVERVFARVRSGHVVGTETIGGAPAAHLAFRGEKVDWQVWVAAAGEPLIRRIVITWREQPGAPQYAATFLSWEFEPRLEDADFAFTPAPDAVRCEFETLGAKPTGEAGGATK